MKKHPGCKPVDIVAAGKRPEGREVTWAAIRKSKQFTILELEGETRINLKTIYNYVIGLERAGYLKRIDDGSPTAKGMYSKGTWELIKDVGVEAPRVTKEGKHVTHGLSREQMWRTIKMISEFNAQDMVVHASTDDVTVTISQAKYYLKYLARGGYIRIVEKGKQGGPLTLYRFVKARYTGPKPPMIQRVRQLFDPNLGVVVWPKEGDQ